jgi:16S rRNA A1518/A1519 N6-dimethyltransferase RsmA/KsgA/DIM1 with predicted DNA glycosylase/AP lyase activity
MKRKKWLNSLKKNNSPYYEQAKQWLESKGYPETYRAEQITVDEFKEMWLSFK